MCTHSFILQSDWYRQSKVPEVDNFSLPPPPLFLRRELGDEARGGEGGGREGGGRKGERGREEG